MSGIARHHAEWLSLIEISGPFLTLPVLLRVFPQGLPKQETAKVGRLRSAYEEWADVQGGKADEAAAIHATWILLVLNELLEFDDGTLRSGSHLPSGLNVPLAEQHETMQPTMAIVEPTGSVRAGSPRLLVTTWPLGQDLEFTVPGARWAASPLERMTQLCRSTGVRLGLVTNGERWTLVDAPVGQTAGYASWYAGLWLQEPLTLAAFSALLGVRRFFAAGEPDTLTAMLDESVAYQQEVTDQLGFQVRRAVEVLVQALDRADFDRQRNLLRDVSPDRLYEASLTMMMRLVFLFCAEERGLLLLGDETYDVNYAVSTLRALLREEADRVGVEVLERRQDAWARLLAIFRAVYGGIEHEALRLPALGGSLFDPDRFPFLEGRGVGTSWLDTPASPLPIDNRTVLHLLEALQLLRMRGGDGTSEARKLSYRALDIEQIGHVYEGLLDHIAVRVEADTLGLIGTRDQEPELTIDDLDRQRTRGKAAIVEFLKERTGRSESALHNDLDTEVDEDIEQRLLVACDNDKVLLERVLPYHALIRKDAWGYPLVYRAKSFMVTGGSERRQTGTHYTPKSLTEKIVADTLEPLVYMGPAEGKGREEWNLRSPAELLDLKICDMAMGSAAFLVQVCRYLGERLVESWEQAERSGATISVSGELLEKDAGDALLPSVREERLSLARRLIVERCVYGVDINPMAVELAKLSLWLITVAKGHPFGFLDHNLRCGDSLLGVVNLDQVENFHLDAERGKDLHRTLFDPRQQIRTAIKKASDLRKYLGAIRVLDIEDAREMARLNGEARNLLERALLVGDLLVGATIESAGQRTETSDAQLAQLADDIATWLGQGAPHRRLLEKRAQEFLATDSPERFGARRPFHWVLEFPEVFERSRGGFDAMISNPPFMGGRRISSNYGEAYEKYLKRVVLAGEKGSINLVLYFLLRGAELLRVYGAAGFIATDAIRESDTREVGVSRLFKIVSPIRAISSIPWSGSASVSVSILGLWKGEWRGKIILDSREVGAITTQLEAGVELATPHRLLQNAGICSDGVKVQGIGFVLSAEEAGSIIKSHPESTQVITRYIVGDDINTDVQQLGDRWVINFWNMSESDAMRFVAAWDIVVERVRPYREGLTRQVHEECFWKFWDRREAFFNRVRKKGKVLVGSKLSKHFALVFGDPHFIYSEKAKVFDFASYSAFAVLQSTFHTIWALQWGSSTGETPAYVGGACFDTFPFPECLLKRGSVASDIEWDSLCAAGDRYYEHRGSIGRNREEGLTKLYNRFHDRAEKAADVMAFRECSIELDATVAQSYGWQDLKMDHGFYETRTGIRFTISGNCRAEILARTMELNTRRYILEQEGDSSQRRPARVQKIKLRKRN